MHLGQYVQRLDHQLHQVRHLVTVSLDHILDTVTNAELEVRVKSALLNTKDVDATRVDVRASGGVVTPDGKEWWPSREAMEGAARQREIEQPGRQATQADYAGLREYLRPHMVQIVQCRRVLLDGVFNHTGVSFFAFDGATATAPIDAVGSSSKTASNVPPLSVVFIRPPVPRPT